MSSKLSAVLNLTERVAKVALIAVPAIRQIVIVWNQVQPGAFLLRSKEL